MTQKRILEELHNQTEKAAINRVAEFEKKSPNDRESYLSSLSEEQLHALADSIEYLMNIKQLQSITPESRTRILELAELGEVVEKKIEDFDIAQLDAEEEASRKSVEDFEKSSPEQRKETLGQLSPDALDTLSQDINWFMKKLQISEEADKPGFKDRLAGLGELQTLVAAKQEASRNYAAYMTMARETELITKTNGKSGDPKIAGGLTEFVNKLTENKIGFLIEDIRRREPQNAEKFLGPILAKQQQIQNAKSTDLQTKPEEPAPKKPRLQ